ncbi:MAG: amidase family protein, partial [Cyclobacteriaceae bacterium]|nr:amidase family protein [Cyclobacteriaceae bacterium]
MKYFPVFFLVFFVSCKTNVSENSYPTAAMEPLFGISLTMAERDSMTDGLLENETAYKALHHHLLENSIPPALLFNPIPVHFSWNETREPVNYGLREEAVVPENFEDLAFYSLADLSNLLKTGKVTSTQLTEMYLGRLKKYGDTLQCVVTLTEDLAREQAALADAEIAAGHYRGPLHGIPYGAKDLLAVEGYKTTWGAAPYQDQELTGTATVIKKLEEAGAVLVAKLTLGAIAYGDVWFGGKTKNPWNLKQGSSGSSAGSASATVAGLVAFAIGTETHGSIVSPSTRCGATGLR